MIHSTNRLFQSPPTSYPWFFNKSTFRNLPTSYSSCIQLIEFSKILQLSTHHLFGKSIFPESSNFVFIIYSTNRLFWNHPASCSSFMQQSGFSKILQLSIRHLFNKWVFPKSANSVFITYSTDRFVQNPPTSYSSFIQQVDVSEKKTT